MSVTTSVVNFDNAEPECFHWGQLQWILNAACGNTENLTFGRAIIRTGQSNPRHRHPNCDELLYLLRGKIEHFAEDVGTVSMRPGDAIHIPAGIAHSARCTSEQDAEMLVVYSSANREIESV